MPRKTRDQRRHQIVEIIDTLPPREGGVTWAAKLRVAFENKSRWCRVAVFRSAQQAQNAQSNLNRRYMDIPDPDGLWDFASRGPELYARYRGSELDARLRRTQ